MEPDSISPSGAMCQGTSSVISRWGNPQWRPLRDFSPAETRDVCRGLCPSLSHNVVVLWGVSLEPVHWHQAAVSGLQTHGRSCQSSESLSWLLPAQPGVMATFKCSPCPGLHPQSVPVDSLVLTFQQPPMSLSIGGYSDSRVSRWHREQ